MQSEFGGQPNSAYGYADEEEEYEDEIMSQGQRSGFTNRVADQNIKTPNRSHTSLQPALDPIQQQKQGSLQNPYGAQFRHRDPQQHNELFDQTLQESHGPNDNRPQDVKMPRMIEAHKAQSVLEKPQMGGQNYDLKSIRTYKEPIPSFLPDDDKYQKFQQVLQTDENDLRGRLKPKTNDYDTFDQSEKYDVSRRATKQKGMVSYVDPFKAHMQKMEDKLKYGDMPPPAGGMADPNNRRNQAFMSQPRQREIQGLAQDQGNTLSLPQIRTNIDTMENRMENEIDREVKLRRDAKKLIINAVRKEPTLDRNVKAWLKTERDNTKPILDEQVFTRQYRQLIYQEIKKDKNSFPLMNHLMNQGVVRAITDMKEEPLQKAKNKYKLLNEAKKLLNPYDPKKIDYEKIKKVYNASLLDSELQDPLAYLLKKKQDAKTCIMHVFKRKYEEKMVHQQLMDPRTLKREKPALEEKLKVIKTAIELSRQRLEWVLFDTPFTIKQLEDEINNAKSGNNMEHEREKEILKQFLKENKQNAQNYEETQQRARDARNLMNLQILEIRALKNRTGCDTIADFVLMFRELISMDRLENAKIILQDGLVNKKKTQELYDFINLVIQYEDEMIKIKQEYANDKFVEGKFENDKFFNYDEIVLEKINVANKEDFVQQFKQDKLVFPFIPFWFIPIDGFEKNLSDILRRMIKLQPNEARVLCNYIGCTTLNEFTTLMRHTKNIKEFILFDKNDLTYLRREHALEEVMLKNFANLISILAKEYLMVPQLMFDLAQPTSMLEVNLSDFKGEHLTPDAISAIIACIQNFQSNVKKLIFRNCQIDSKGAQLFKFLLSDEKRPITMCDFDNNNLEDAGIDQIMNGIKNNPRGDMRILKLSNNKLSITAAIRLAHILKKRSATLPPVNLQVLKLSHNSIGNIGAETLIGFMKKNEILKYLDISFNQIGDRGLVAVAESFKENTHLEVLNLLGNEFTDKALKMLTDTLGENKKSKLSILKIGHIQSDAEQFERFLNVGFMKAAVLNYLYVTTNQYMIPAVKKIIDTEGENPKTLVVTEAYDPKLDSQMVFELMSQISEMDVFEGGDPDQIFKFGEKILYDVIKEKYDMSNLEVLIYLFEYIFAPDYILSDNISPMHLFAKFGSMEAMYYCLRLKVSPNFKTSIAYQEYPSATSLHIASGYSQLEMCKFLLTSSLTEINCKDLHGNTPLHYAAVAGSSQLAILLVNHGASCLQTNKKKMLPLHSCVFSDHVVCFKFILQETDKQKTKQFQGKQVEAAVDFKTYNGFTPLMLALEEKADTIFQFLVANGADLKAQDEEGNSILHRSIMMQDNKKCKYLIKEGSDIYQRTFAGETPLMMAVRFGLADVVRMMALKGADLFEKNFKGDSLLHLAARMDQAEVIGYLLDKGLQTIDMNRDGQRPMDLAVRPAIKQLLSLENPKSHDVYSNSQTYGGKLQARIKTDNLKNNSAQNEQEALLNKVDAQKNGRLLNEAIIKYRIEKKDIVDSVYKSRFSGYGGASQLSMVEGQSQAGFANGSIMNEEEELQMDDNEEQEAEGRIRRPQIDFGEDEEDEEQIEQPKRSQGGRTMQGTGIAGKVQAESAGFKAATQKK